MADIRNDVYLRRSDVLLRNVQPDGVVIIIMIMIKYG